MRCRHLAAREARCGAAVTVGASHGMFGRNAYREIGDRARALGMCRAALVITHPALACW